MWHSGLMENVKNTTTLRPCRDRVNKMAVDKREFRCELKIVYDMKDYINVRPKADEKPA